MNMGRRVNGLLNEIALQTRKKSGLKNEHSDTKHHAKHRHDCLPLLADEVNPCDV
jgi:hypothetical protein